MGNQQLMKRTTLAQQSTLDLEFSQQYSVDALKISATNGPINILNFPYWRILNYCANKDNRFLQFWGDKISGGMWWDQTNKMYAQKQVSCRPLTIGEYNQQYNYFESDQVWRIVPDYNSPSRYRIVNMQKRTNKICLQWVCDQNNKTQPVECCQFTSSARQNKTSIYNSNEQLWQIQHDHGRWYRIRNCQSQNNDRYLELLTGNNGLGNGSLVICKPFDKNSKRQLWSFTPASYQPKNMSKCSCVFKNQQEGLIGAVHQKGILWQRSKLPGQRILYYYFIDGSSQNRQVTRESFHQWQQAGIWIRFQEILNIQQAHIRITFSLDQGCYVKRPGNRLLPYDKNEPYTRFNMCLNWVSNDHWSDALHQTGHVLGFKHQHQTPSSGFQFNWENLQKNRARQQVPWSQDMYQYQKLDKNMFIYTDYDVCSIMHYDFSADEIVKPFPYNKTGIGMPIALSHMDKKRIRQMYPDQNNDIDPDL